MTSARICRRCASAEASPSRADRGDYRCAPCAARDMREYRAENPDKAREQRQPQDARRIQDSARYRRVKADPAKRAKHLARVATRDAVRRGKLTRLPCEVCGTSSVEGHHDDYSQPLAVRWLCTIHHRELHAAERTAARA